uniref:D-2-hydroxyacid dehydrogenase n=1 Tax=Altererythrobacter segetis TaxID=1104773 RepID=UPI00140C9708|nr:D-2-hydroxyacid dehydrogenase [Altererythrobacter segetis]
MTLAVLPGRMRALVEPLLPDWLAPRWWNSPEELVALAPQAEIGWFDLHDKPPVLAAVAGATELRWLNTAYAGVNWLPLADLERRGVALTCGRGLTATAVAEFAVMTMLAVAKGYPAVVRAQDRGEWLEHAPGTRELAGSRALILGQGAIGRAIDRMLQGFEVETAAVRRGDGVGWKARLAEFDWIVLALPGTSETRGLIGATELAAMKREAVLVNFARADIVDQAALADALREKRIAAAVLDVTDPEPLPPGHPLWSLDNAHITMHLSGIPTPASLQRAAERFARNCERFRKGEPLEARVDLALGY